MAHVETAEITPQKKDPQIKKEEKHILPLLPLKNVIILPKSILPIIVGREI